MLEFEEPEKEIKDPEKKENENIQDMEKDDILAVEEIEIEELDSILLGEHIETRE